jgi:hypothetical protein
MNKPESVRLEVFKFNLSPRKSYKGTNSFRDLFIKRTEEPANIENTKLYSSFFKHMISILDSEYKVVRNKAFTLINENNQTSFSAPKNIIYGVLEGGQMGEGKTRRKLKNKTNSNSLDGDVINDKYFFYIYAPLNDSNGYIMFQIYQQDNIREEFMSFIFKEIYKNETDYNMPNYDVFIPQSIKDEFKSSAKVKELKFTETVLSTEIEKSASFMSINESYKIEIKITPVKSKIQMSLLDTLVQPFLKKSFNGIGLDNFDKKNVVLKNNKKTATFEMDGAGDIMPRIYLKGKIPITQFGVPDFEELKKYCDGILDGILSEQPKVKEI